MFKNLKIFDNRILILYILETAVSGLSTNQIMSFCSEFDDITYFDICDYIQNLESNNYIEPKKDSNAGIYTITENGLNILNELLELIPGADLYKLKKIITKNIISIKTEYTINSEIIPVKNDEFKISCYIKDGKEEVVNLTLYGGNKLETKNISKNWQENAEKIYSDILKELTQKND